MGARPALGSWSVVRAASAVRRSVNAAPALRAARRVASWARSALVGVPEISVSGLPASVRTAAAAAARSTGCGPAGRIRCGVDEDHRQHGAGAAVVDEPFGSEIFELDLGRRGV